VSANCLGHKAQNNGAATNSTQRSRRRTLRWRRRSAEALRHGFPTVCVSNPHCLSFPCPPLTFYLRQDGSGRSRRTAHESGSFGKSTRRSRSKTGTPARRDDPTVTGADKIFSSWAASQAQPAAQETSPTDAAQREDGTAPAATQTRFAPKAQEPTEVILRGYRSAQQQYAAISHYEQLAGRICEDYPREPPAESRWYKSELRDAAYTQRRVLTPEERAKVNKTDGGEHWVKVTFESAAAADNAIYSSPQSILGHLVFAEPYRGIPPSRDEPIVDTSPLDADEAGFSRRRSVRSANAAGFARNMMNPDTYDLQAETAPGRNRRARDFGVDEVDAAGFHRGMLNPDETDFDRPRRRVVSGADASSFSRTMLNPDEFESDPYRQQAQAQDTSAVAGFARGMMNPDEQEFNPRRRQEQSARARTSGADATGFARYMMNPDGFGDSPPQSRASSRTVDTGTISSGTAMGTAAAREATPAAGTPIGAFVGDSRPEPEPQDEYCRAIPTARKARLLPPEQALLPAPSLTQRLSASMPWIKWFSGSMIGNEVPRTDTGEFDWDRASLYWKVVYWLDLHFGLFGKEVISADKDE